MPLMPRRTAAFTERVIAEAGCRPVDASCDMPPKEEVVATVICFDAPWPATRPIAIALRFHANRVPRN
eukprot:7852219-Lingulodinium_polyedra.AAC.1